MLSCLGASGDPDGEEGSRVIVFPTHYALGGVIAQGELYENDSHSSFPIPHFLKS